jgi:Family of unknown function (DUF5684)
MEPIPRILAQNNGGGGAAALIPVLLILIITLVAIAGAWKTFTKAGKPGWACIVPIYNVIVACQIAGRPLWWAIVILIVPCLDAVFGIIVSIDIAKSFGRGAGFGIGLALLPIFFYPMLGFGDSQYAGPAAAQGAAA